MFVQISPSSSDSGETLNSLKYASRVRTVEHGPARKQADPVESSKLKQMVSLLLHHNEKLTLSIALILTENCISD
jgi:kinesin family member C2/C3